ncbi:hypothetical protein AQUCO_00500337v1 [Aquilegia coerulea]|uniref:F-box associated beta-propeller type 3 domain-containing protein n=1 Tax=Aquilegia coerulea TaxID=218851 RepID=A0A2G5ERI1_AQUCA|nr:hypothetical protein AQUCO_00500337v1 [Aquilegia coerulea]
MYICNPATRDYVKLPKFKSIISSLVFGFGFGFDVINKEFKVVVVIKPFFGSQREAQVYTLGSSNCWRTVNNAPKENFFYSSSAFVNGSLHWFAYDESESGLKSRRIVTFNLSSEDFGVIATHEFSNQHYLNASNEIVEFGRDYNVKTSWTRFIVSKFSLDGIQFKKFNAISFQKNGEIILLCDNSKLVSYNTDSGNVMALEVDGMKNLDDFRKIGVPIYCGPKLHLLIMPTSTINIHNSIYKSTPELGSIVASIPTQILTPQLLPLYMGASLGERDNYNKELGQKAQIPSPFGQKDISKKVAIKRTNL